MTVMKCSLLAAVAATGLTAAGLFSHRQRQFQTAGRLRVENERLQQEIETRVRAQRPAVDRPSETARAALEPAVRPESVAAADHAAPAKPEPDYRNEGNATPQATLQTFAWACDQGDVAAVTRLIRFDEAARTRALAYMAELPEEVRKRWETPEMMAAMLLVDAAMHSPFPHATVLDSVDTKRISPERVKLELPGNPRADGEYQLTPEGWKYAITSERVEAYLSSNKSR
jgi:hypothetical protein